MREVNNANTSTEGAVSRDRTRPIDTLAWPSGPFWKDCETLDEARDLADRNGDLYLWSTYTLYEAGSEAQQRGRIEKPNHGKI